MFDETQISEIIDYVLKSTDYTYTIISLDLIEPYLGLSVICGNEEHIIGFISYSFNRFRVNHIPPINYDYVRESYVLEFDSELNIKFIEHNVYKIGD